METVLEQVRFDMIGRRTGTYRELAFFYRCFGLQF